MGRRIFKVNGQCAMVERVFKFLRSSLLPTLLTLILSFVCHSAAAYEPYVSVGINSHSVKYDTRDETFDSQSPSDSGPILGAGVLNQYGRSNKHYFGFGVEWHELLDDSVLALRALDYQYQLASRIRLGSYFGAVDLDSGASQTGYYIGANLRYLNIYKNLDAVLDVRVTDKLQRDRFFENDPVDASGKRPDFFVSYNAIALLLSWRF